MTNATTTQLRKFEAFIGFREAFAIQTKQIFKITESDLVSVLDRVEIKELAASDSNVYTFLFIDGNLFTNGFRCSDENVEMYTDQTKEVYNQVMENLKK